MVEKKIGVIEHYFTHVGVAAIKLTDTLIVGDTIHVVGATTDFTQKIDSMQIQRTPVQKASSGDEIGIKVKDRVREHDVIYKITEEKTL